MRNILVTGGSRGIGLAIARRLAASGDYNVVAVARRESEDLGRAIRETGADRLHFRAFDLGQTDKIPAFVKELRDAFGAIYGLVNNAGIGTEGLLANMRNSEIEALIRLNVLSPIVLTKYVVRHMMADGAGRIVNISSIIASTGYNGLSVYAAAKAAAAGFSRSLAREVGRLGITVNAIAPGYIDTDMVAAVPAEVLAKIVARIPVGRLGQASEIARGVLFLVADEGGFITGSTLSINGGQHMY
jgi:3-oxoacyl-[acyl-carrier protein] reductase